MASRLDLQAALESISGVRKVYFQPPESIKLTYPCVIYEFSKYDIKHADDVNYVASKEYELTLIDKNSDSSIPDLIVQRFKTLRFDRMFVNDGLYHWAFKLFY